VTRLTALGFVQRDPGRKDARTVRVRLTRKGRMAVIRLQGLWDEVERDLLKDLSADEQRQLQELLLRVAMNFSPVLENNETDFPPRVCHGGSTSDASPPSLQQR
jgi:DNA-binding MarR family transcriptional regulator